VAGITERHGIIVGTFGAHSSGKNMMGIDGKLSRASMTSLPFDET